MKNYKFVTIGDAGIGKTAYIMRYTYDTYQQTDMTIGVDFAIRKIDENTKIQIWDTAGHESFRSISRSYYHGANVALFMYDSTNLKSFRNIQNWYLDFKSANEKAYCIFIETKYDLSHKRVITPDMHNEFLNILNERDRELYIHFQTSAKTNYKIEEPFNYAISLLNTYEISDDYPKLELNNDIQVNQNIFFKLFKNCWPY